MRRTALPLLVLALLIGAVVAIQYRWLTELAGAARIRMERDLRVAVQATAGTVDLELAKLGAAVSSGSAGEGDSLLASWAGIAPELAGLIARNPGTLPTLRVGRSNSPRELALDSVWIADSLLPGLARRIGQNAELGVSLALVHMDSAGRERVVARSGPTTGDAADAAAPIFAAGVTQRVFFVRTNEAGKDREPQVATWTARENTAGEESPASRGGWELRAWHAAGSLERAAERLRRRNLAVGFGLMALLAAVGGWTIASYHRSRRLAEDRVAILAGISHEARTPLAVIRSAADNLAEGVTVNTREVAEYGRMIEAQAERLTGVLEGALAFARVADPSVRTRGRFDLREVVGETVRETEDPSRILVDSGEPVWLEGDRHSIATAIRNLVANALAYSGASERVELGIARTADGVEVVVADRGPGVPATERDRIFEPFQRGSTGTASGRGGLGLGLTLAHRVARLHGGNLRHDARDGGGSLFRLRLPTAL